MIPDPELLRRYRDGADSEALGLLVSRYVDLVYSAALRQMRGNVHQAEEIAQVVFTDFARKAATLTHHTALSGWFFTSTHYAAAKLMRTEQRRRTRETEAHAMNEITRDSGPEAGWNQLQPVLDAVMHELNERDRTLVLLRFFERRPLADIGTQLGVSEPTAAKALERAMDKLRAWFARRGVTSTSGVLALALANHAVATAPGGLAPGITTTLLAGTPVAGSAATTAAFFAMSKSTSILVTALFISLAGFAVFQTTAANRLRHERAALRADVSRLGSQAQRDAMTLRAAAEDRAALRASQAEIATLRGEITALKAAPAPKAVAAPPAATRVLMRFANVGRATPLAALETMVWAMENGQVAAAHDVVVYDEGAQGIFQLIFNELSAPARTYFGTPAVMALAAGASAPGGPPPRVEIVEETMQGPDAASLRFRWNDEPRPRPALNLRRHSDGWKVVAESRPFMRDPAVQAEIKRRVEDLAANASK